MRLLITQINKICQERESTAPMKGKLPFIACSMRAPMHRQVHNRAKAKKELSCQGLEIRSFYRLIAT